MSGTKRVLLAMALVGLGARCIYVPLGVHRGPPGAVVVGPPPGAGMLSRGEAVNVGWQYCQSRHIPCDLQEAHLTGSGVWKVKFKVRSGDEKGHVHMDIDGRSGAVLRVDQKVKERGEHGHGHGRGRDDD